MTSEAEAAEIAALAATMLPGDGAFPPGDVVGAQAALVVRLVAMRGEAGLDDLLAALAAAGGPLVGRDEPARTAIVGAFERAAPALFADVRRLLYLAYYEQPLVIRAIRASGLEHNLTPLPAGYAVPRFDPAIDAPRHGRGRWTPTASVVRIGPHG